jgi:hypothetical protein
VADETVEEGKEVLFGQCEGFEADLGELGLWTIGDEAEFEMSGLDRQGTERTVDGAE